ncbi:hypothetical protein [Pelagibius sp. Alg239-R121]|uniref:hypothetical protein n=1 Tax=Pelagibius sp. Alg239-R121 TaxID=2993448 RepID=UPI0024A67178|nr:hypothetical protein [Pelagibius sp. Alg239-R121]
MLNFNGLNAIFHAARRRQESTIAFELKQGIGQFVFMMFFADEDDDASRDHLHLLLRRTGVMHTLKMYGSRWKGEFNLFHSALLKLENDVKAELGIQGGSTAFDSVKFFTELNARVPQTLPLVRSIPVVRENREAIKRLRKIVDEATKVYLIGPQHLPEGKAPREKTLRKLYLHIDAPPTQLTEFITLLKQRNMTVSWTDNPARHRPNLAEHKVLRS